MTRALFFICLAIVSLMLLSPLQGQKTDQLESEKMATIKKELEEQEKQRISYPEHLYQSEAWEPITEPSTSNPPKNISWYLFSLMAVLFMGTSWVLYSQRRKKVSTPILTQNQIPNALLSDANRQLTELRKGIDSTLSTTTLQLAEKLLQSLLTYDSHNPQLHDGMQIKLEALDAGNLAVKAIAPPGNDGEVISLRMTQEMASIPGAVLTVESDQIQGLEFILTLPEEQKIDSGSMDSEPIEEVISSPSIPIVDQEFLAKAKQIVLDNLGEASFNAEAFRQEVGMSKTQFYRKLHALTAQSPGQYIRALRLERASELLEEKRSNVSEVAYEVGFNNLSYFAKCFRKQYGKLPSEI